MLIFTRKFQKHSLASEHTIYIKRTEHCHLTSQMLFKPIINFKFRLCICWDQRIISCKFSDERKTHPQESIRKRFKLGSFSLSRVLFCGQRYGCRNRIRFLRDFAWHYIQKEMGGPNWESFSYDKRSKEPLRWISKFCCC